MARYTGSVCRMCRREGTKLFLKGEKCFSEKCALGKRPTPPGQHGQARQRKPSEYGMQLREKQKCRRAYGLLETQFYKTYERANLKKFTAPLTMDEILDEYARELNFEGVRWPLLKRLGLLEERVTLHAGDTKKEDPQLASDYIHPRKNFSSKWWRWPIPQDILDVMPGYGQNEGWY